MAEEITALVVDDEPAILQIVARLLQSRGAKVDTAPTTSAGLDYLTKSAYDVVITDLNQTPSGVEVYREALKRGIHNAYILTGGTEQQSLMDLAVQEAGENLLFKPVQIETLYSIVDKAKARKTTQS